MGRSLRQHTRTIRSLGFYGCREGKCGALIRAHECTVLSENGMPDPGLPACSGYRRRCASLPCIYSGCTRADNVAERPDPRTEQRLVGLEPVQLEHTSGHDLDRPASRCGLDANFRFVVDVLMAVLQERASLPQMRRDMVSFRGWSSRLAHQACLVPDEDQMADDFVRTPLSFDAR